MLYIKSSNPSEAYKCGPKNQPSLFQIFTCLWLMKNSIGPDIGLVPNRRKLIIDTNYYIRFK